MMSRDRPVFIFIFVLIKTASLVAIEKNVINKMYTFIRDTIKIEMKLER